MLALDDSALARIVIGATAVAPDERRRWLEQIARKLDPPKSCNLQDSPPPKFRNLRNSPPRPATRQARWRERQRKGRAIFRIEADHDSVLLALIETGRISEADALDRRKVEAALATVLADFGRRWMW